MLIQKRNQDPKNAKEKAIIAEKVAAIWGTA